jgi:hypothetical protein
MRVRGADYEQTASGHPRPRRENRADRALIMNKLLLTIPGDAKKTAQTGRLL